MPAVQPSSSYSPARATRTKHPDQYPHIPVAAQRTLQSRPRRPVSFEPPLTQRNHHFTAPLPRGQPTRWETVAPSPSPALPGFQAVHRTTLGYSGIRQPSGYGSGRHAAMRSTGPCSSMPAVPPPLSAQSNKHGAVSHPRAGGTPVLQCAPAEARTGHVDPEGSVSKTNRYCCSGQPRELGRALPPLPKPPPSATPEGPAHTLHVLG